MGEVIRLPRIRKETVRGASRKILTDANAAVGEPSAVIIIALGKDGTFALRSVTNYDIADFDAYSRAAALLDRRRMQMVDDDWT